MSSFSLHHFTSSAPLQLPSSSAPLQPHSSSAPLHLPSSSSSSVPLHSSSSSFLRPSVFSSSPPLPPPHPPPAHCSCSSILSRLLSAHRLEVRRLLRGALSSLNRRLDSLERLGSSRRRKRRRKRRREGPAPELSPPNCTTVVPLTTTSSSSSSSSYTSSNRLQSCQGGRGEVGSRSIHGGGLVQEEEGRFVGRMAVSFRGGTEEVKEHLLTLHTFNQPTHRRREEDGGVTMTTNGYTTPMLLLRSYSQQALHLQHMEQSRWINSQSEAFTFSTSQWGFSERTPPLSLSSNCSAARMWPCRSWTVNPTPLLRLSTATLDTVLEAVMGGAYWSPQRPLKDWTAPPSLSADHCYVRMVKISPALSARRQQRRRANRGSCTVHLLRGRALSACLANGLCAPAPSIQSTASANVEQRKRVSQIRIRRASPRETLLTPMGLPKVKRLKKKEFSLEEIYTNKNYKSPSSNRSLETIFEEPREKDGSLLLIGQQKRRRILLFPDFTQPRKRKKLQGVGLPVAMAPRKRAAARRHVHGSSDDCDLDVMLVERLSALEDFLSRQGLDT
ncbi:unnamed protein product [Ophioblennius macclurei]